MIVSTINPPWQSQGHEFSLFFTIGPSGSNVVTLVWYCECADTRRPTGSHWRLHARRTKREMLRPAIVGRVTSMPGDSGSLRVSARRQRLRLLAPLDALSFRRGGYYAAQKSRSHCGKMPGFDDELAIIDRNGISVGSSRQQIESDGRPTGTV